MLFLVFVASVVAAACALALMSLFAPSPAAPREQLRQERGAADTD
jgi:hypothetical protein